VNYKSWDDEGLRRVLLTDLDDTAAICEAAERFARADGYTQDDLDAAEQNAREAAYGEGYNVGYAEGNRTDDSR
jgi:hypothetical protein